jgi:hypothetical protein
VSANVLLPRPSQLSCIWFVRCITYLRRDVDIAPASARPLAHVAIRQQRRRRLLFDTVRTLPSTSCAGALACMCSGCCRVATANQSEGGRFLLSRPLSPFCVSWGRWQVLIYLFRAPKTDNRALTMDVTGRNIPPSLHQQFGCSWRRSTHISLRHGGTLRICDTRCAREDDRLLSLRVRTGTTSANANIDALISVHASVSWIREWELS